MTNRPDIALTVQTSGWVEITNNGGRNSRKTFAFLQANRKHMNEVCFGNTGTANMGTLAIKAERVARFIAWAAQNGLHAEVGA